MQPNSLIKGVSRHVRKAMVPSPVESERRGDEGGRQGDLGDDACGVWVTHGFVRNDRGDLGAGHDTSEETEED